MESQFSIGIDEYTMTLTGESIRATVQGSAPGVSLVFKIVVHSSYQQQLVNSEIDLIIAPLWQKLDGIETETLYTEDFVGLMSQEHELTDKKVTLKRYTDYRHVLVSNKGIVQGNVDVGLRRENMRRQVVMTTPWVESAVRFVEQSDMLLNMGRQLANRLVKNHAVNQFELPLKVPGFDVCMMWHPRDTNDIYNQWLRNCVLDQFQ